MDKTPARFCRRAITRPRAAAYVASAVHSSGADLDQIEAFVRGRAGARVLDLGCGGGHVSYRVAPHVREVVACDLTPDMLAQVKRPAAERGLANIVDAAGRRRAAAVRGRPLSMSSCAGSARITGTISRPACARRGAC